MIPAASRARLVKVLGRLGSDHAGERAAAGLLAARMVRAAGLSWGDVVTPGPAATLDENPATSVQLSADHGPFHEDGLGGLCRDRDGSGPRPSPPTRPARRGDRPRHRGAGGGGEGRGVVGTAMCSTDRTEAPAAGGDDPEEAGDGPEAYEPVLTDEERLELRRAWLAAVRLPAGRAGR